ncbi:MAG: MerR family DNA-binding transcriptional regulator [Acidimicrobiales bacterium]
MRAGKLWTQIQRQEDATIEIGQVAELAGVSVDTVRFYDRRGVPPTPQRLPSGYRTYASRTREAR